ncbi:MAG: flavin reductase family protein [Bacteroidetes bacterium]|nr:flavin reductase family protein [Bacteroidota bacterium]
MSALKKKPWNRLDLPVYSVASHDGTQYNMNICTYASQVSMQPKRYMVAVYKGTKTLDNISGQGSFVLQILSTAHLDLINRLGKQSGHIKDKLKTISRRLTDYHGYRILADALAVIELQILSQTDAGDHMLALCDVVSYRNITEGEILMLHHLRDKKLISI